MLRHMTTRSQPTVQTWHDDAPSLVEGMPAPFDDPLGRQALKDVPLDITFYSNPPLPRS